GGDAADEARGHLRIEDHRDALRLRLARSEHARGALRGGAADFFGRLQIGQLATGIAPGGRLELSIGFGDRRAIDVDIGSARLPARAVTGGDGGLGDEVARAGGVELAHRRVLSAYASASAAPALRASLTRSSQVLSRFMRPCLPP